MRKLGFVYNFRFLDILRPWDCTQKKTRPKLWKCRTQHRFITARVKKRVSDRVLQRVVHIIRSETLERRLASAKSLAKSLAESLTKSLVEALSETLGESRIALYAWLFARLSPRLVRANTSSITVHLGKVLKMSSARRKFSTRREFYGNFYHT